MQRFSFLLTGALFAASAAAERPQRADELREVLQQPRPAAPRDQQRQQQQQPQRVLSEQERAELRRQLAEARDANRPARHSVR